MRISKRALQILLCATVIPLGMVACGEDPLSPGDDTGDNADGTGATSASGGSESGGSGGTGAAPALTGGTSAGGGQGGLGGVGGLGGATATNYITNPGFEEGNADKVSAIPGWSESLDVVASYLETGGRSGAQHLGHWKEWVSTGDWYQVETSQTVSGIPNGTYTFSVWVMRSEWFGEQYLFARNYDGIGSELTVDTLTNFSDSSYVQVTLSGIVVTTGSVTVGIHSVADAGVWANFDDASLTSE